MSPRKSMVFYGNNSNYLAEKMADKLKLPIGKMEFLKFQNGEIRLRIISQVKGKKCLVVQSTSRPINDNLIELFLLVDTLKHNGAKSITALMPYFSYSRQHKKFRSGECVSAETIFQILSSLGVRKVITMDYHNLEEVKFLPIDLKNVSVLPLLAKNISKNISKTNLIVVSPDKGGHGRAKVFAKHLLSKNTPVIFLKKRRHLKYSHQIKYDRKMKESLKGKDVMLVDDICTSGKTLLSAAKICLSKGAHKVLAVIVHNDMDQKTAKKLANSPISKIYFSNTSSSPVIGHPKISMVDISSSIIKPNLL